MSSNKPIDIIKMAGAIKKEFNLLHNFCVNPFFNDSISLINLDIFYTRPMINSLLYENNLFKIPTNFIRSKNGHHYKMCDICILDLNLMNNFTSFLSDKKVILNYHSAHNLLLNDSSIYSIDHTHIFESEELKTLYSKNIAHIQNKRVIMPYINEETFFDKKNGNRKECISINIDENSNMPLEEDFKSKLVDEIIYSNKYKGTEDINVLLNSHKMIIDYQGNPCATLNFAAMICGCIPICINPNIPYNESIMRNGETCFIAQSEEEADDIIHMLAENDSLYKSISSNAQEIMKMVNNKEKFLDSWNSEIN